MPRGSGGDYQLPTGNPVVSDTLIEASWANTTLDDLANAMTDSLSRSGKGGMTAAFKIADGTKSAPGLSFTAEASSGLYRNSAGEVVMSVLGVDHMRWNAGVTQIWNGAVWTSIISEAPSDDNYYSRINDGWAVDPQIELNRLGIIANTDAIGVNETNILSNLALINTNITNIGINAAAIATGTYTNIDALDVRVTQNESDLSLVSAAVLANADAISTGAYTNPETLDDRATALEGQTGSAWELDALQASGDYVGANTVFTASGNIDAGACVVKGVGATTVAQGRSNADGLERVFCINTGSTQLASGQDRSMILNGYVRLDTWSFFVGAILWLDANGQPTDVEPTGSELYKVRIGYAIRSNIIYFNPQVSKPEQNPT